MDEQNQTREIRTAADIQQEFCETFWKSDWIEYRGEKQLPEMKRKLAYALYGPPNAAEAISDSGDIVEIENKLIGYNAKQKSSAESLYGKIIEYKKLSYDGETIYMNVIFICCVPYNSKTAPIDHATIESDKTMMSPVFVVRHCLGRNGCRVFVDNIGRVYKSWADYKSGNKSPKGVMIVPKDGRYTFDDDGKCEFEAFKSPALLPRERIKRGVVATATVGSLGAAGVAIGSLALPIAAPVVFGAVIVGGVTGLISGAISGMEIKDRHKHTQTLKLSDPDARNCWINIGASVFATSATATTSLIARNITQGAVIGQALKSLHNVSVIGAAVSGAAGITSNLYTMIYNFREHGSTPTPLEVLQFSSSVFFLYHSTINLKTANALIRETQITTIDEVRLNLDSNRQRRMFDKMSAETRRRHGDFIKGNAEIISSLKNIDNKSDFFAKMARINKELNRNDVKVWFDGEGGVRLNSEFHTVPDNLSAMNTEVRQELLSSIGPSQLSTENWPTKLPALETPNVGLSTTCITIENAGNLLRLIQIAGNEINPGADHLTNLLQVFSCICKVYASSIEDKFLDKISGYMVKIISALTPHHREILNYLRLRENFSELICSYILQKIAEFLQDKGVTLARFQDHIDDSHLVKFAALLSDWLQNVSMLPYETVECKICQCTYYTH